MPHVDNSMNGYGLKVSVEVTKAICCCFTAY